MPGIDGTRGTMPVARITRSKPRRLSAETRAVQFDAHAELPQPRAEIPERFREFLLARNPACEVELAADLARRLEQGDVMATRRGCGRAREPRRPRAHDHHLQPLRGGLQTHFGFAACKRVDEARCDLPGEDVIEARLVAADARVDFVGAIFRCLVDELRIGQERPRHRHHVGIAARKNRFARGRVVDPVGRDERDVHRTFQPPGHPRKGRSRHHRANGRNARLVPADAGVDDRSTRDFDDLGQLHDFIPGAAAFHQVEHRQPVDDDEFRPDSFARAAHDLHREAHAMLEGAAPFVVAVVGLGRHELVDEVALRPHDLHAVVSRALRQLRTAHVVGDGLAHTPAGQAARAKRADRRTRRRWRDGKRVIRVASRVQDLQRNLSTRGVHGVRDDPVARELPRKGEL